MLVERRSDLISGAPHRQIASEALPLFRRIGQFMKAVRKLDTVAVELEAARGARIGRVEARQRRLGRAWATKR